MLNLKMRFISLAWDSEIFCLILSDINKYPDRTERNMCQYLNAYESIEKLRVAKEDTLMK